MASLLVFTPIEPSNKKIEPIILTWFVCELRRLYELNHNLFVISSSSEEEACLRDIGLPRSIPVKIIPHNILASPLFIEYFMRVKPNVLYFSHLALETHPLKNVFSKILVETVKKVCEASQVKLVIGYERAATKHSTISMAIDKSWIKVSDKKINNTLKETWLVLGDTTEHIWQDLDEIAGQKNIKPIVIVLKTNLEWTLLERRDFLSRRSLTNKNLSVSLGASIDDQIKVNYVLNLIQNAKLIIFDPTANLDKKTEFLLAWAVQEKKQLYPVQLTLENENQTDRLYHQMFSN